MDLRFGNFEPKGTSDYLGRNGFKSVHVSCFEENALV